jgi:sarcosine oxidase subunit alpha
MPPGFYYKTFMWPQNAWRIYEGVIKRASGYGTAPEAPDPDRYDQINAHVDVLVIGGGPAGLSAALEAGRAGARVLIADEQNEMGGSLLSDRGLANGALATDWLKASLSELDAMDEVTVLKHATAFGYYDHNFLGIAESVSDHLLSDSNTVPRQRLWRIRANHVILATGAIERPLVFPNNDRPGVMLASAVSTYINRYAVNPAIKAVVFTNNDNAYQSALDLHRIGVHVSAVIDVRPKPIGKLAEQVRGLGITVLEGHVVVDVKGGKSVNGVTVMPLDRSGNAVVGKSHRLDCDLVAISGGWNPTVHLHCQSGGTLRYDPGTSSFIPDSVMQAMQNAGSCKGSFTLEQCLMDGRLAGAKAAREIGLRLDTSSGNNATVQSPPQEPVTPMWLVPSPKPLGLGPKQFVDLQTDTTAADIAIAVREGYESIEHIKRYTTCGMGTDQGKLGNVNAIGILANLKGTDPETIGATTYRPMYTPVPFGTVAGRSIGSLFDPVRKTSIHQWHEESGALFENVGQWKRPWYYPRPTESMQDAVYRECMATRTGVSLLDASTLGKIEIKGPDATTMLNMIYTNAWSKLEIGRCRYGLMLGEDGMLLDDGVTARLGEYHYLMHTTTGGAATVMAWLERWLQTEWRDLEVYLTSTTDHWTTISINGPDSRRVVGKLSNDIDFSNEAFPFMSIRHGTVAGVPARVFRVSFVGELSYEINVSSNHGRRIWEAVIEAGIEYGITPLGTEAMHVLRAEKGYIIIGQDTDGSVTPNDLGMDWIVSKRKKDFLGKRSLYRSDILRQDRKQMVGLLTDDPHVVLPEGGQIVDNTSAAIPVPMVGHVTSSYMSPFLKRSIALALIKGGHSIIGEKVYIPLENGKTVSAMIVDRVFYDREGARQDE